MQNMEQSFSRGQDHIPETVNAENSVEVKFHGAFIGAGILLQALTAAVIVWVIRAREDGLSGIYNDLGLANSVLMILCLAIFFSLFDCLRSFRCAFTDRGIESSIYYKMLFFNVYTYKIFVPWNKILNVYELEKGILFHYMLDSGKKGRIGLNFLLANYKTALAYAIGKLPASKFDDDSRERIRKLGIDFPEPSTDASGADAGSPEPAADNKTGALCLNCGSEAPAGASICPDCRHVLPATGSGGSENDPDTKREAVSDKWIWALMFVPLGGTVLQMFVNRFMGPLELWMALYGTLNISFMLADRMVLREKGYKLRGLWFWIGCALVPLYLIIRAAKVNRQYIYILLYCAFFAVTVFVENRFGGAMGGGIRNEFNDIENMAMVFVEGGTFKMGCTPEQARACRDAEKPVRSVTVSDFSIGKYEVTQRQWKQVMGGVNPSYTVNDRHPVENVSYDDIQEFIVRLNAKTGMNYRLPTEAEWEYAARGGGKSRNFKYSGGNKADDVAWHVSGRTRAAGTKMPNELGIYDMSGNVAEWVLDWNADYTGDNLFDPAGPRRGRFRVFRNCGFGTPAEYCRVSYRNGGTPNLKTVDLGFRLARDE